MFPHNIGHKRLKKSLENHKKDVEAELNKIKDNVEVSAEQLSEKFSSIESNTQDLNSRMSQIKSNLSKYIFEEPFQRYIVFEFLYFQVIININLDNNFGQINNIINF